MEAHDLELGDWPPELGYREPPSPQYGWEFPDANPEEVQQVVGVPKREVLVKRFFKTFRDD